MIYKLHSINRNTFVYYLMNRFLPIKCTSIRFVYSDWYFSGIICALEMIQWQVNYIIVGKIHNFFKFLFMFMFMFQFIFIFIYKYHFFFQTEWLSDSQVCRFYCYCCCFDSFFWSADQNSTKHWTTTNTNNTNHPLKSNECWSGKFTYKNERS